MENSQNQEHDNFQLIFEIQGMLGCLSPAIKGDITMLTDRLVQCSTAYHYRRWLN